jgi:hypothetical protein
MESPGGTAGSGADCCASAPHRRRMAVSSFVGDRKMSLCCGSGVLAGIPPDTAVPLFYFCFLVDSIVQLFRNAVFPCTLARRISASYQTFSYRIVRQASLTDIWRVQRVRQNTV